MLKSSSEWIMKTKIFLLKRNAHHYKAKKKKLP